MRLTDSSRVTYGSQITPHIWEDNNGQLIIRDAVLARCGSYDYLESEILPDGDKTKIVKVYRTPEEVFNPASMASFENKPFCDNHPDEDVCLSNYKDLQKGFLRDVRRGTGELKDCLIGDIVVTDPEIIDVIKSGDKRELSLGYNTQIVLGEDGKYYMTKIRGNHIALVDDGRAGVATIRDRNSIKNIKGGHEMPKKVVFRTKDKNAFINKLYDEDVVEIEELEDDDDVVMKEVSEEIAPVKSATDDFSSVVLAKLDEILGLLKKNDVVADSELPVKTEEVVKTEELKEDEDVTADETVKEDEPKLFDAEADNEEVTAEGEAVEEETIDEDEDDDDDDDEDVDVQDSAKKVYSQFASVTDKAVNPDVADEVNQAFKERYKKFGGKN